MEPREAYTRAHDVFDRAVHQVGQAWDAPTPCPKWTTRDLVNHLVSEQLWVPHTVAGETVEQVGDRYDGDVLGPDPAAAWVSASAAAQRAWRDVPDERPVHLSYATVPASEYRWQLTLDLSAHGWDLAKAAGAAPDLGDALATALLDEFTDQIPLWRGTLFADEVEVPADADPQTRLVALLGRDPDWAPPA
ncbi:TIGR03086 family metal-binding protein [Actinokineospora iranica]|uniref:TIGR03086 family protein n=1 Tax=Actinokineospora iranica TaxID=1271860 RepID=A0A1G6JIF3_9PSEU|nr:TIGR03086 family metal-binding protein [Actinokineospora iranica]SDC18519.1 TIGR03086 family protein [Actinokineospora iranica]